MKLAKIHIVGVTPCIMHNGQTASPLNKFAKAMKEISGKRKKTDADHEALALIELEAAFYLDDQGRPCWPGENIEAGFIAAAKKLKLGQQAKSAVVCDGLWPLLYTGPKHYQKLMTDSAFVDSRNVRVQQSRIVRTRPIFRDWELKFELHFHDDLINESALRQIMDIFGEQIGLSDFRPKYGRFLVESCEIA